MHQVSIMGSTVDKAAAIANDAAGKVRQRVGKVTGSDNLQELRGDAQKAAGGAKAAVGGR
jgi:uncharacterized protein YjbJ (UPF0337 family)